MSDINNKMIKQQKPKRKRKRLVFIDDKYAFRSKKAFWLCDDVWDIVKEYAGIYNLPINYKKINRIGVKPLNNFYRSNFSYKITNANSNVKNAKKMIFKGMITKGMDKDKWLKLQSLTIRTISGWDDTLHTGHKFKVGNWSYEHLYLGGNSVLNGNRYIRFNVDRITKCWVFVVDIKGNKFKGKKKYDERSACEYIHFKSKEDLPFNCSFDVKLRADNYWCGWYKFRSENHNDGNNGWIDYGWRGY